MNDIYGCDCLALSGRLYFFIPVPRATALRAFALGCYATPLQGVGTRAFRHASFTFCAFALGCYATGFQPV